MTKKQQADEPTQNGTLAFFTVIEAARYLRLSKAKVYQTMDAGELAFCKFGRSRRVPLKALEQYVQKCTVNA